MNDRLFNFKKLSKNFKKLSDVDNRIHRIIEDYNPPKNNQYEDKKINLSILNTVKSSFLDFDLNRASNSMLI